MDPSPGEEREIWTIVVGAHALWEVQAYPVLADLCRAAPARKAIGHKISADVTSPFFTSRPKFTIHYPTKCPPTMSSTQIWPARERTLATPECAKIGGHLIKLSRGHQINFPGRKRWTPNSPACIYICIYMYIYVYICIYMYIYLPKQIYIYISIINQPIFCLIF